MGWEAIGSNGSVETNLSAGAIIRHGARRTRTVKYGGTCEPDWKTNTSSVAAERSRPACGTTAGRVGWAPYHSHPRAGTTRAAPQHHFRSFLTVPGFSVSSTGEIARHSSTSNVMAYFIRHSNLCQASLPPGRRPPTSPGSAAWPRAAKPPGWRQTGFHEGISPRRDALALQELLAGAGYQTPRCGGRGWL